jgi:hypothetical protein
MAILLDEEKVVKIVKFDFLVKMKLLLEMALEGMMKCAGGFTGVRV